MGRVAMEVDLLALRFPHPRINGVEANLRGTLAFAVKPPLQTGEVIDLLRAPFAPRRREVAISPFEGRVGALGPPPDGTVRRVCHGRGG